MNDSFPRQHARTQRFTLGEPRNVTVSPDGARVVFLRSSAGDDPVNALWTLDASTGEERLIADPRRLLGTDDVGSAGMTDEERARRERTRDGSSGITSYATDAQTKVVAFEIAGRLFVGGLLTGAARAMNVPGPVFDPRPDPTASRLAYVSGRTLCLADLDGATRVLAGDDESTTVSWGRADFIAAEEMHRFRGYWWNPDGTAIVACRVDEEPVGNWTIADPATPHAPARTIAYPAAGTANAVVTLHIIDLDGNRREVDWDREFFPYVAHVEWSDGGLVFSAQSRDQRSSIVVRVDAATGEGEVIAGDYDDTWVENVPGVPTLLADGRLLTASDRDGRRRLMIDDEPITPDDVQVRSVAHCAADEIGLAIVYQANRLEDPTEIHLWSTGGDGHHTQLTEQPGVHSAVGGGGTLVVKSASLDRPGNVHTVRSLARPGDTDADHTVIASHAETPVLDAAPTLLRVGERELATAVFFPSGYEPDGSDPLPVLVDPYGGPHAQRVTKVHNTHLTSQWFADRGFVVVVTDGRGTPGRGAEFERAVHLDLAMPPLEDQIDALHAVAERSDCLDLDRVAIRGWSFGGYLAGLAVLERPDVFHAAIAGAPVTEWRLYDTHYTERYLGDPTATDPHDGSSVYDHNSLLTRAADLRRPLLLVHGLADDNVVAAHTLQLSSALLAAGRPHEVLPLVGVSHMTAPQEVVAENLLVHQLDFLSRALGLDLESS